MYPTTAKINEKLLLLSKVIHVVKSYVCSKAFIFPLLLSISSRFIHLVFRLFPCINSTHPRLFFSLSLQFWCQWIKIIIYQYLCHTDLSGSCTNSRTYVYINEKGQNFVLSKSGSRILIFCLKFHRLFIYIKKFVRFSVGFTLSDKKLRISLEGVFYLNKNCNFK